jgi:two-component system chemotaxis response regulator CheB
VLFSRPSIDVLMESCADVYGPELAGIVLTGANEDGARGLATIKALGGLTAVQDPAEAAHATMPQAALDATGPDFVLPLAGLRALLHTVVR